MSNTRVCKNCGQRYRREADACPACRREPDVLATGPSLVTKLVAVLIAVAFVGSAVASMF